MHFWVSPSFLTARLRKPFAGEVFKGDCDKGFAGRVGSDGLRDVACDLSEDLLKDTGEKFSKRSLSVIRGSTVTLSDDFFNKNAEVKDLRGT